MVVRTKGQAVYRLVGVGPGGSSVIAKRRVWRSTDPELVFNLRIHPILSVRLPECYGFVEPDEGDRGTLFQEDAGLEPYRMRSPEHRELAAHWLADREHAFAQATVDESTLELLPDRGPDAHLALLEDARDRIAAWAPADDEAVDAPRQRLVAILDKAAERWSVIEEICALLPTTLVHGDFRSKNLRVHAGVGGPELLVIDWEYAGLGLAVTDLGATMVDVPEYVRSLRLSSAEFPSAEALRDVGSIFSVITALSWVTEDGWWEDPETYDAYCSGVEKALRNLDQGARI